MATEHKKVAVVGAGYWGKNLVRNFHALGALGAVCDASPKTQEEVTKNYPGIKVTASFEAILADPELAAVAIATPAETHGKLVRQALLAGKDVFVEKPLCLSPVEGRELVELSRTTGRVLMVGHLLWYHPAVLKLKALIDAGELGRIEYIYSTRLNLGKIRREENILWSFAPHDISVILGLMGEMPEKVAAQGGNYLHEKIADVTVTLLGFPSGKKAHIFVSWLHPFKEQKLVVVGEKKMAVFDDLETDKKLTLYPHSIEWVNQVPIAKKADGQVVALDAVEPLNAECKHFLDRVVDRKTPRTDGEEALRVLTVLQRCQEALSGPPSETPVAKTPERAPAPVYKAHESAFIDDGVEIGAGTQIWHVSHVIKGTKVGRNCRIGQNVVLGPNVVVGDGVKIQNNVSVYEGVTLEDNVFCGPSMVFTNVMNPRSEIVRKNEYRPTLIKQGASLGANSTVVCGHTVGRYAFVGAGSVVTRDVPDFALVMGVPGKVAGWVCRCGDRLDFAVAAPKGAQSVCKGCGLGYGATGGAIGQLPAKV